MQVTVLTASEINKIIWLHDRFLFLIVYPIKIIIIIIT